MPDQIKYYFKEDTNQILVSGSDNKADMNALLTSSKSPNPDFDPEYTRISADNTSSYFDLYCNGLEPERYYTILVKTSINGEVKVFDENIMFKVAKG